MWTVVPVLHLVGSLCGRYLSSSLTQCDPGWCPQWLLWFHPNMELSFLTHLTLRLGSRHHAHSWLHPHLIFLLSSANLSDSYFTNRQDRYVFLQDCAEIADFFTELVDAVGDVSLQLQGDDTVEVVDGMVHPYKGRTPVNLLPSMH